MARVDLSRLASEGNHSLPEDYVFLTRRRLAIAASLTGAIHGIYIALYETVWIAANNPIGFWTTVVGMVASLGIAAYLFSAARSARAVTAVGVGYEVLLALSLGFSDAVTQTFAEPSSQVPWSAVVIVLFPFLIPATPRIVLASSLVSAAMTPLAMASIFSLQGRPWPDVATSISVVLPPFLCALLAWAPTSALYRLGAAVQQARRLGNYELTERLGAGGMGEVWRARHRLLARPAAVKLIKPEILGAKDDASRAQVVARFEQEARVTASLDSPHTVELYDFGVSAGGELFYVMELLDGLDAETLVARFGPLPSERVAYLLMQACNSLEDAHGRGLVHRDIKPANLFVARKGVEFDFLKVLDFGLVKRWHSHDDPSTGESRASAASVGQTALGELVGTPAFLAPESVGTAGVDQRADLYALGCVGYWLLTGRMVFEDETAMAMAVAHVTRIPERPSSRISTPIAPALEDLIMQCLAKDRDQRPASARVLRLRLAAIPFAEPWSSERAALWWSERRSPPAAGPPPASSNAAGGS